MCTALLKEIKEVDPRFGGVKTATAAAIIREEGETPLCSADLIPPRLIFHVEALLFNNVRHSKTKSQRPLNKSTPSTSYLSQPSARRPIFKFNLRGTKAWLLPLSRALLFSCKEIFSPAHIKYETTTPEPEKIRRRALLLFLCCSRSPRNENDHLHFCNQVSY